MIAKTLKTFALVAVCFVLQSQGFVDKNSPVYFSYRYNICPSQPSSCIPQQHQFAALSSDNTTSRRGFLRQRNNNTNRSNNYNYNNNNDNYRDSNPLVLFAGGEGNDEELVEKVKAVVAEQLGADINKITPQSHFIKDLEADSLDSVELVMAFEEKFGVTIPDEEATKITTVQEAVDYIQKHKN